MDDADFGDLSLAIRGKVKALCQLELDFKPLIGAQCFVAGTQIHTDDGLVSIENIQEGILVLSRDPDSGRLEYKRVVETFVTYPERLYHITISSGGPGGNLRQQVLSCTGEHPFYSMDEERFMPAAELQVGVQLLTSNQSTARIDEIQIEEALEGEHFTTYNFEVADFHTYFAGSTGIWVHNLSTKKCREYELFIQNESEALKYLPQDLIDNRYNLLLAAQRSFSASKTLDPKTSGYAIVVTCQKMLDDFASGALKKLDKYPTVHRLRKQYFKNTKQGGVEIHHAVEMYIQRMMGIPADEILEGGAKLGNTVPGVPMPGRKAVLETMNEGLDEADKLKAIHRGRISDDELEPDGLSALLQSRIPISGRDPITNKPLTKQQVIDKLHELYTDDDYPEFHNMWPIARDWLRDMRLRGKLDADLTIPEIDK